MQTIILLLFAATLWTVLATTPGSEQEGLRPPENETRVRSSRPENTCGAAARCVRARYCAATRNELRLDDLSACGGRGSASMVCCPIPETVRDTQPSRATDTTPRHTNQGSIQPNCGRSINLRPLRPSDVGAENARKRQFPWMVALTFKNGSEHETLECGAALIDSRHLLTAAHCIRSNDPHGYKARIGALDWRQGSSHDIARISVHPEFTKGQFYDDIAVMTLAQEVTDPQVRSICLPDDELLSVRLDGHGTTVAGWGTTNYGGERSRTLKYVSAIPVIPNTECQTRLESRVSGFRREFPRGLTRGILCAGFMEGGKDSCGGDSGGPLMLRRKGRYYAIGIVSFGYGCGKAGYLAGYTRISEYADFIRTSTQD